jgi:photosystem II stability/assembly factor-like uncharacterized protein
VYTSAGSARDRVEGVAGSNGDVCLAGSVEQATGYHGSILRSTDNGATWLSLGDYGYVYAVESLGDSIVMAGNRDGATSGNVLRSTDNGATWVAAYSDTVGVYRLRKISPTIALAARMNTVGALRSTDAGANWNVVSDLSSVFLMRDFAVELAA